MSTEKSLYNEMKELLNKHSIENASNTPDYILSLYLLACLNAYESAVNRRDKWYNFNPQSNITTDENNNRI